MKRIAASALWAALVAAAAPAVACPVCDNGTGPQVRAELADEKLGISILATVAPFAVVLGVVAAVHFGPPQLRKRHE